MKKTLSHTYDDIISPDNLLNAWKEFVVGKKSRKDVQQFERNLMTNIISLHQDLTNKTYKHSKYEAFNISDPKPRNIHKAKVRDRLLHHAICRVLFIFYHNIFISDSYSSQKFKGTHRAITRFQKFGLKVSKNNTKTCWVLKCDIKKFFASIDHKILTKVLEERIKDRNIIWLLEIIINSFETNHGKGLPLGNLTSQLLVNIYMDEFDKFMKHQLKTKYYIRYADDFVALSDKKEHLVSMVPKINSFLSKRLKLTLHPDKVLIQTIASGVDFLGWVHFPNHKVLRTATKKRMFKSFNKGDEATKQSYLGLLSHGNTWKLKKRLKVLL